MPIKRKNILLIASSDFEKRLYYTSLLSLPGSTMEKSKIDSTSIIYYDQTYKNKLYKLQIKACNTIGLNRNANYDGIIEIYSSNDGLLFLNDFEEKFHSVYGNKNFPTVYVKFSLSDEKQNKNFPFININLNNNEVIEWNKVFTLLLSEIKKEKNDEFPYNIPYYKHTKMNKCFRHILLFNIGNYCLFGFLIFCALIDFLEIFIGRDYVNSVISSDVIMTEMKFINCVGNFMIGVVCIRYFIEEFFEKIKKVQYYGVILNILIILWEAVNRIYNRSSININRSFYAVKFVHIANLLTYITGILLIQNVYSEIKVNNAIEEKKQGKYVKVSQNLSSEGRESKARYYKFD